MVRYYSNTFISGLSSEFVRFKMNLVSLILSTIIKHFQTWHSYRSTIKKRGERDNMLSKWRSLSITLFCDVFFLDRSSLNQLIWHLSLTHSQSLVWLETWQWDAKMRKTLPGDFLLCLCDQMSLCLSLVTSLGGFPGETGGVRRTATRLIMSGDARLSLSAGELWVSCFSSACVWLELSWWGWGSFSIRDEGGNRSDLEHGDILLKAVERFALWPSEPERTNILHFQIIYHTLKDFLL